MSQIITYDRCHRRWLLKSARRVQLPDNWGKKSAQLGNEIHELIKRYYWTGALPPPEHLHYKKVVAALENCPPRHDQVLSETFFKLQLGPDLPVFTGIVDLVDSRDWPSVRVIDHKTSSRFNQLELEPVDVGNDPQMLTYSEVQYQKGAEHVQVAHNTISTTHVARVSAIRWTPVSRQRSADNWGKQLESIRNMLALAQSPPADWNDVPANESACGDYGGCDFLPICSLKTPLLGVPTMAHDTDQASALLARLSALSGVVTAAPPPPPPAVIEVAPVVIEAPLSLVETSEIRLLPPDAPSRMTPAEEEPKAAAKKGRPKKAAASAPSFADFPKYDFQVDRLFDAAPEEIEGYLEAKQDDGWEFLCWYSGLYPMFRRLRVS